MSMSEDIARELAQIRAEFTETKETHDKQRKVAEELTLEHAKLAKKADNMRLLRDEARYTANQTSSQLNPLRKKIEELERALRRAHEQEKAAEGLLAFAEKLNLDTMSAPWRKENRDDGEGALGHQIDGAIVLAAASLGSAKPDVGGFCFDKRGLGKTLTASGPWLDFVNAKRICYLTTNDTMRNVEREIRHWAPHRTIFRLGGRDKIQREMVYDLVTELKNIVLVVNYQAWRKDWSVIDELSKLSFDALVYDEVHNLNKKYTNARAGVTALQFATNKCPTCDSIPVWRCTSCHKWNEGFYSRCQTKYPNGEPCEKERDIFSAQIFMCSTCGEEGNGANFMSVGASVMMTGTPILNKPQELWPILNLGYPSAFPSEYSFLRDFCRQEWVVDENSKNGGKFVWVWRNDNAKDSLLNKISHRVIMRNPNDAGVEIPPQHVVEHEIPFDEDRYPRQAKILRQINEYAAIRLAEDKVVTLRTILSVIMRKRQGINWPAGIKFPVYDKDGNKIDELQVDVDESIKIDKAEELIKEFVEEGDRVVVFSQFRATLEELSRRISRSIRYDGSTSDEIKGAVELDFDARTAPNQPKWDVVLANYKSAGEGLNFNAATRMIILDEEWNPGKRDQAYGRINRMGQKRETQAHVIRVEKSIDTWMLSLIQQKEEIIGGFESAASLAQRLRDAILGGDIL